MSPDARTRLKVGSVINPVLRDEILDRIQSQQITNDEVDVIIKKVKVGKSGHKTERDSAQRVFLALAESYNLSPDQVDVILRKKGIFGTIRLDVATNGNDAVLIVGTLTRDGNDIVQALIASNRLGRKAVEFIVDQNRFYWTSGWLRDENKKYPLDRAIALYNDVISSLSNKGLLTKRDVAQLLGDHYPGNEVFWEKETMQALHKKHLLTPRHVWAIDASQDWGIELLLDLLERYEYGHRIVTGALTHVDLKAEKGMRIVRAVGEQAAFSKSGLDYVLGKINPNSPDGREVIDILVQSPHFDKHLLSKVVKDLLLENHEGDATLRMLLKTCKPKLFTKNVIRKIVKETDPNSEWGATRIALLAKKGLLRKKNGEHIRSRTLPSSETGMGVVRSLEQLGIVSNHDGLGSSHGHQRTK